MYAQFPLEILISSASNNLFPFTSCPYIAQYFNTGLTNILYTIVNMYSWQLYSKSECKLSKLHVYIVGFILFYKLLLPPWLVKFPKYLNSHFCSVHSLSNNKRFGCKINESREEWGMNSKKYFRICGSVSRLTWRNFRVRCMDFDLPKSNICMYIKTFLFLVEIFRISGIRRLWI